VVTAPPKAVIPPTPKVETPHVNVAQPVPAKPIKTAPVDTIKSAPVVPVVAKNVSVWGESVKNSVLRSKLSALHMSYVARYGSSTQNPL
jgi:hypothetical protein